MTITSQIRRSPLLDRLRENRPLVAVELRPPRSDLSSPESMSTWIDMYHSIRRLASRDTAIFLTDNAVGQLEEENLRHLTTNIAGDVNPGKIVPFLTTKHSLEYCLMYATRAESHGFGTLTVLGGDRSVGPARCVNHASDLRRLIRAHAPSLTLGGWVNPHRPAREQVGFIQPHGFTADFCLTQIVSHHSVRAVEHLLQEVARQNVTCPLVFGVFLYRSANPRTLSALARFLPVPVQELTREFQSGQKAEQICARTIRALRDVGASHVYISNLGYRRAVPRYLRIIDALETQAHTR